MSKAKKKASNWKGGSFKAAVGGFLKGKARKAGKKVKRGLMSGLKRCFRA